MKILAIAIALCVVTCLVAIAFGAPRAEMLSGMIGPAVAALGTWFVVARVHRSDPVRVTSLLVAAFAAKFVFFGGYVVFVTTVWDLELVPFMASFATYFVALYVVQATLIRGLSTAR